MRITVLGEVCMIAEAIVKEGKVLPFIFRHPWIFKGALEKISGKYQDGQVVRVIGPKGDFIAWGWVNSRSKLMIRLICFQEDFQEEEWFRNKIRQAIYLREEFLSLSSQSNSYRLIHSEGDGIPGLIVDLYGDHIIAQFSCLALDRLQPILVDELAKIEGIEGIVRKDDPVMTKMEGMIHHDSTLRGKDLPLEFILQENGIQFKIQFGKDQKTGFYLDQRENRRILVKYAGGAKRILDAFCYTGGFSLNLAKHLDVDEIISVDSSEEALAQLEDNAVLNRCKNITPLQGNVFHLLEDFLQREETFDLIILDPPKFIPNKRSFDKGFSGYKKLNRRAFRLIKPGGLLFTCCCSQMMGDDPFLRMLAEAAGEAGREAMIVEKRYQPPDHPVRIACPEGSYLKGFLLRVH